MHLIAKIISGLTILLTSLIPGYGQGSNDLPVLTIRTDTLENGLQVVYQPDSSAGEVVVEFWMKAGVAHEQTDQFGIAHFYEHVTPYGLTGKPEKRIEFDSFLTGSNAQTLKDFTRYYLKTKPTGLSVTLEYVADRMGADATAITDRKVTYELERVLSEIDRQAKHPFWSIEGATALDQSAFGSRHPYGHSSYGTLANNQQFAVADFQSWHTRYLHPANSILFIVGNFRESEARDLVERYFARIPTGHARAPMAIPSVDHDQRNMEVHTETGSPTHYRVWVWPLPEYGHDDHPALLLTAYLLENRLKQVRPDGWSMPEDASPGVLHRTFRKGGQLVAYLPYVANSRGKRVAQQLEQVVRELLAEGFTVAELAMVKGQALEDGQKKLARLGFQSSRTELIGQGLLFAGDPAFYQKEWQQVQSASVGDIQRVMDKWLVGNAAEVIILGKLNRTEDGKNE